MSGLWAVVLGWLLGAGLGYAALKTAEAAHAAAALLAFLGFVPWGLVGALAGWFLLRGAA